MQLGQYYWGEPERAPPRALQRLRSLSHNGDNNNISYVLAPVYKRLYFIRDVMYISRAHALRANVKPALKVQRSPKSASRTNTFTTVSSWLCGSASHRLALIIVWKLATLLKEVITSSLALRLLIAYEHFYYELAVWVRISPTSPHHCLAVSYAAEVSQNQLTSPTSAAQCTREQRQTTHALDGTFTRGI